MWRPADKVFAAAEAVLLRGGGLSVTVRIEKARGAADIRVASRFIPWGVCADTIDVVARGSAWAGYYNHGARGANMVGRCFTMSQGACHSSCTAGARGRASEYWAFRSVRVGRCHRGTTNKEPYSTSARGIDARRAHSLYYESSSHAGARKCIMCVPDGKLSGTDSSPSSCLFDQIKPVA